MRNWIGSPSPQTDWSRNSVLDLNRELQRPLGAVEQRQYSVAGDGGDLASIIS